MASTPFVQTPAQLAADAPVMGSIWTPGAVLAGALCFGVRGGLMAAVVVSATLLAVQDRPRAGAGRHPADRARRADRRVRRDRAAPAGRAGPPGRGRRGGRAGAGAAGPGRARRGACRCWGFRAGWRGRGVGGDVAELGRLAGEQEFALRALLTTGPAAVDATGRRDLAAALRTLGSTRVSVATPALPGQVGRGRRAARRGPAHRRRVPGVHPRPGRAGARRVPAAGRRAARPRRRWSPALTERETEVLRLVAKGLTARQIGDRLRLSHRTVESHVQNTLRKLQLHNRAPAGPVRDRAGPGRRVTRRCRCARAAAWPAVADGGRPLPGSDS